MNPIIYFDNFFIPDAFRFAIVDDCVIVEASAEMVCNIRWNRTFIQCEVDGKPGERNDFVVSNPHCIQDENKFFCWPKSICMNHLDESLCANCSVLHQIWQS